jgi:hypothetical protein
MAPLSQVVMSVGKQRYIQMVQTVNIPWHLRSFNGMMSSDSLMNTQKSPINPVVCRGLTTASKSNRDDVLR